VAEYISSISKNILQVKMEGPSRNSFQPAAHGKYFYTNGSHDHRSVEGGVEAAETETQLPPRGHGNRDVSNIDPKRLRRFLLN
jgi:hypothetical protein